jgi:hypothetical protein
MNSLRRKLEQVFLQLFASINLAVVSACLCNGECNLFRAGAQAQTGFFIRLHFLHQMVQPEPCPRQFR